MKDRGVEGKELREVMAPEVRGPPVLGQESAGSDGGVGRPVTGSASSGLLVTGV